MTATMKFRITEDADAMTLIVEAIGNIEKKYELLDLVYRAYVGDDMQYRLATVVCDYSPMHLPKKIFPPSPWSMVGMIAFADCGGGNSNDPEFIPFMNRHNENKRLATNELFKMGEVEFVERYEEINDPWTYSVFGKLADAVQHYEYEWVI